jgi:phage shock protein C
MSTHNYRVNHTLRKDLVHKKISGVCAGIARHFELPRIIVRAAFVIAGLMAPLTVVVVYFVAALLMPNKH